MEVKTLAAMPIAKVDEASRTVIGVVYKASKAVGEDGKPVDKSTIDTHGNWATEAEVKRHAIISIKSCKTKSWLEKSVLTSSTMKRPVMA